MANSPFMQMDDNVQELKMVTAVVQKMVSNRGP